MEFCFSLTFTAIAFSGFGKFIFYVKGCFLQVSGVHAAANIRVCSQLYGSLFGSLFGSSWQLVWQLMASLGSQSAWTVSLDPLGGHHWRAHASHGYTPIFSCRASHRSTGGWSGRARAADQISIFFIPYRGVNATFACRCRASTTTHPRAAFGAESGAAPSPARPR